MQIILTRATDPGRRIPAIKALRNVAVPITSGTAKMGLKEAKEIVDDVCGFRPGSAGEHPPTPRIIEVADDAYLGDLSANFDWNEVVPDTAFSTDVPRGLVVDLLLDAMACMTIEQAREFRSMQSYHDVRNLLA